MKALLIFIFSIWPVLLFSQVTILDENFTDGNLTNNPEWNGDTNEFIIVNEADNNQLRLNDADASNTSSQLVTESGAAFGSWTFFINQDFAPSNSNRAFLFLIADADDLSDDMNGYAIRTGESGSEDRFRLFRFDDGSASELLAGQLDISSGGPFQIKVTRTEDGTWELFESSGYGSEPISAGTIKDTVHTVSSHFGIRTDYTSTRSQNFYFDDIIITNSEEFRVTSALASSSRQLIVNFNYKLNENSISPSSFAVTQLGSPQQTTRINNGFSVRLDYSTNIPDGNYTISVNDIESIYGDVIPANTELEFTLENPFELLDAIASENNEILLEFNQEINFSTVDVTDFIINDDPISSETNITLTEADQLLLEFPDPLPSGSLRVEITDLESSDGWAIPPGTNVQIFIYDRYQPGDIVINEIMKDPPPGTAEYVELRNTSGRFLNLKDWQVGDNNAFTDISDSDFTIFPDSFVVISADTMTLLSYFGEANYTLSSLPALNNGSDEVRVYNENGTLVDSLFYTSDWGGIDVAIERREASVSSIFKENWGDSPAGKFGTPGFKNEIKADVDPPKIDELTIEDSETIILVFSERVDNTTAEDPSNYILRQNPESGAVIPTLPSVTTASQFSADSIRLILDNDLQEYDGSWTLEAQNLTDIFGNTATTSFEFNYFNIVTAKKGQVAINEFMYDPPGELSEFIELYNHSDSSFNLRNWTLNDNRGTLETITVSDRVLPSGDYLILTSDSSLLPQFPNTSLLTMDSRFPALNNGTDAIVIKNEAGLIIDSLTYNSEWGGEEVSLERRDVKFSANFQENWGDSPSGNKATPGLPNQIQPDTMAPQLSDLQQISSNQLRLIFSERLQQEPAEALSNFMLTANNVSDPPTLKSTAFSAPDSIFLEFESDLPSQASGTTYELSVTKQSDIFNNTAQKITQNFFVIEYSSADSGDVFINEFMFNPLDGFTDFIELYNATKQPFDLQGWTYNDNSGDRRIISDQELTLLPNQYIVLAPDSLIVDLFPNIRLQDMGSGFANLNSTTPDNIVIRDAEGVLIDSLTYQPSWGGRSTSLERRSTLVAGLYRENWGNSPADNSATPGLPNQVPEDRSPPLIQNLTVVNDSTLRILYSERIQPGPAKDHNKYSFSIPLNFEESLPEIESIDINQPDTVIIRYEKKIPREQDGTYLGLNIQGQTDIFGNVAELLNAQFFLIDLSDSNPGDVVINEFMYDPEGMISEFIELYNHTDRNFDLFGWMLNDNTGSRRTISDTNFELPTNSYVILAPDSSLVDQFPTRNIIVMGTRFPALNNSTDAIVISNADSVIIDSLTYSSDWGGEGVSLERLSPTASSIYRENWTDSPAEEGSTPGRQNQVQPDETPPDVLQASYSSADSIRITFSERVDSTLAHDLNSYSISPSVSIREVAGYSGSALYLILNTDLADGTTYTVTVENQQDIFGNMMNSGEASFDYVLLSGAEPRDVIVNEILYRRASANSEEFIELFNRTDKNFDLSGWTFSDATGSTDIPEGTQIRSGEFLVLTDSEPVDNENALRVKRGSSQNQLTNAVYVPGFPSLNDDEDEVVIKNESGVVIDSLFYSETWGGNQPGISLERKDPLSASNDASNWASNTSESGNSAGQQSSVFQPDETSPEIIFAKLQPDEKIFVAFSEFISVPNTNVFVNEEPVAITDYDESSANIVILGEDAFPSGEPLLVSFDQVQDFRGNISSNLSVEVSQPLAPGNVVINEILFDPLANSDDNLPDQTEYIELYNRSEYAISLEGFFLHDEPDENNETRNIFPITSQFKWIPSGDYALVYAEDQATEFSESQLASYFEMEEADDQFFIQIDRSSLSLASSDDTIYIADSTGATIDSVFYDESWQNPNLFDTDGVALERIDPNGPSSDESNWSSSTRVNGGTPGEQNSIFQESGSGPEETGISFSPNPFSPDDDGFDDNLFINYKLEEPDYLLRVRIFDRYGREVRELADGLQAGFEGSLIWDGLTDDNRKNRVGIYIVLFEAYNSANGKNRTFKETVVLARKF
ncbi:MAG: lamin tail domain-containing protein [Gracilimonas sp.]|nr:lamin tail domain-containing protein [Gracilimonas sp.]